MREEYRNSYEPPPETPPPLDNEHRETEMDDYDFYFCYPVITLRSDRLELRPFLPKLNTKLFYQKVHEHPELTRYFDISETEDQDFRGAENGRRDSKQLRHAIYTRPIQAPLGTHIPTSEYQYAGVCNIYKVDPARLTATIGIFVFKEYQHTHVATHALGLILRRLLQMPGNPPYKRSDSGFGMRRAIWDCHTLNAASISIATRMGFTYEGTVRNYDIMMGEGKVSSGDQPRQGDGKDGHPSSDAWLGSITGRDWEDRVREIVEKQMARTS